MGRLGESTSVELEGGLSASPSRQMSGPELYSFLIAVVRAVNAAKKNSGAAIWTGECGTTKVTLTRGQSK